MNDDAFMAMALAEGERALGNTSPNPMVGAVVARDGAVIASGRHERAGAPHAEAVALERAGEAARGATLYVTLEPCAHHGRMPPCTEAIVRAGIARVVVAVIDDDRQVRGVGIERLRVAGVRVDVGPGEAQAREMNRMYSHQRRFGRPFVTLKMAQSADGAIGLRPGERFQLTGYEAEAFVHRLRYEHDAVMVGVGTVVSDDPQLTVRPHRERAVPYRRIVVDSLARTPLDRHVVRDLAAARTTIVVTAQAPPARVAALRAAGTDVLECASSGEGRVDLRDMLERLGADDVLGILCEGGPTLASALLDVELADELDLLVAPVVLGTASSAPAFVPLRDPRRLRLRSTTHLGDDVLFVARFGESDDSA